ncbi:MAG: dihydrodipicolinate synthase family protein, partial [Microbacteriaceae bacterium]
MKFDGILFFPVTPFDARDRVELDLFGTHVAEGVAHGAGGVFPACGTGEFHALSVAESAAVVRAAVETVAGAVPVVAGAGGPLGHARE